MQVAEALAAYVAEEAVTSVFGLMGDANLAFLAALSRDARVKIFDARHEGSAVAMADGYARASNDVGVASVTCGPGVTHAASSLLVASHHGSPLVVIGGDISTTAKGMGTSLQDLDQRRFVEACGALFHQLRAPRTVAADVERAFAIARAHRRTVFLNCPLDIQEQTVPNDAIYTGSRPRPLATAAPDQEEIERAADMIAASKRPLFVLGDGAVRSGAREVAERVGARVGAAFSTTIRAKGYVDGQWSVGICGSLSSIPGEGLIAVADLVVFIGASGSLETVAAINESVRTIQINTDPEAMAGRRRPDLLILGDARLVLERVDSLLVEAEFTSPGFRVAEFSDYFESDPIDADLAEARWELGPDQMDPRLVMRALDPVLPKDSIVVIGGGHFWSFPTTYLHGYGRRRFIYSFDFGCIGQALPIGFGAAAAAPHLPVVVIEGDSSVLTNIHELETVARYRPRLLVLVMNDNALGAEYHKLAALHMDPTLARLGWVDFAAVARSFGTAATTITSADAIGAQRALFDPQTGPRVIDMRISVNVISRHTRTRLGLRGEHRNPAHGEHQPAAP